MFKLFVHINNKLAITYEKLKLTGEKSLIEYICRDFEKVRLQTTKNSKYDSHRGEDYEG